MLEKVDNEKKDKRRTVADELRAKLGGIMTKEKNQTKAIQELTKLLGDAENSGVADVQVQGLDQIHVREPLRGQLVKEIAKRQEKLVKELKGRVTEAMDGVMEAAGYKITLPPDDAALIDAFNKIEDAGARSRFKNELKDAVDACEKEAKDCHIDTRAWGISKKGGYIFGRLGITYNVGTILDRLIALPPPLSSGSGGESKQPEGITTGVNAESIDTKQEEVELVDESAVFIRGVLNMEYRYGYGTTDDFQTWLGDPTHQEQLVDAAALNDETPERVLARLKHVKQTLKGINGTKPVMKKLNKVIDFATAAVEWNLELDLEGGLWAVQEPVKTIDDVRDLFRIADQIVDGTERANAMTKANKTVHTLTDRYSSNLNGPPQTEQTALPQTEQTEKPLPQPLPLTLPNLVPPQWGLLPPRPARLAVPAATRELGVRKRRAEYAVKSANVKN